VVQATQVQVVLLLHQAQRQGRERLSRYLASANAGLPLGSFSQALFGIVVVVDVEGRKRALFGEHGCIKSVGMWKSGGCQAVHRSQRCIATMRRACWTILCYIPFV